MQKLKGKIAVVSGGGAGIGRAIADKLAASGVTTAIADIQPATDLPEHAFSIPCDVTSGAAIDHFYGQVQEKAGQPDMLVCCAGRGIHEKLTEGDPEKWRQVIDINLMGALRMVRAFVPGMLQKGQGDVVFLSSVSANQAFAYGGVYAATKSALEVVAETLRQETLPTIRVTVISPGVTDTGFFKNTISGFHTAEDIGYGAISADNVADAVLFALNQPEGVSVNHITIRPTAQPF